MIKRFKVGDRIHWTDVFKSSSITFVPYRIIRKVLKDGYEAEWGWGDPSPFRSTKLTNHEARAYSTVEEIQAAPRGGRKRR